MNITDINDTRLKHSLFFVVTPHNVVCSIQRLIYRPSWVPEGDDVPVVVAVTPLKFKPKNLPVKYIKRGGSNRQKLATF